MARPRIAVRFSRDTTSVSLMTKRIPHFVSVPIRVDHEHAVRLNVFNVVCASHSSVAVLVRLSCLFPVAALCTTKEVP